MILLSLKIAFANFYLAKQKDALLIIATFANESLSRLASSQTKIFRDNKERLK
jgi:hypothetical protein